MGIMTFITSPRAGFIGRLCMLIAFLAVSTLAHAVQPVFTEVSVASGIQFQAETNPMAGGIAWIDFNNDGNQDLFVPNASGNNRLYRNEGNGQFTEVAAQAGVQTSAGPALGVAVGDYDGDGYDDIFIASNGINTLYRNKGDGTFTNVTATAGLDDMSKQSFAASFGDVNGDGRLDLYVGHWDFQNLPTLHCPDNDLYLNNGNGTFTNVSVASGTNNPGCAFSVPMTDFDQDGDLDIFLPNDNVAWGSQTRSLDNEMLRNEGVNSSGIPVFVPVGDEVGLGESITGMGVAIGDYDNDGDLDYYRTQIGAGPLSTNDGTNHFNPTYLNGDGNIGWGVAFFDADNDGYLDLYRGNSGSGFGGEGQPNLLFHNNGDGTFTEMAGTVGLTSINAGLGLAYADYDNDGDVDVVVHGQNGDVNLFRNDTSATNHWIKVNLQGRSPNHRGIGARVHVTSMSGAAPTTQMREIQAGSSHGSTHAAQVMFGLGDHTSVNSIVVNWPSGCRQTLTNAAIDTVVVADQSQCHRISGSVITPQGDPVPGIALTVNDNFGLSVPATTDANGRYSQEVTDGLYIVWPSSSNYQVVPAVGTVFVSVSGSDVTKDFVATPLGHVISGTMTDASSGAPLPGVAVTAYNNVGDPPVSVVTDSAGNYALPALRDGVYIVLAVKQGYNVGPVEGSVFQTISGADVTKDYVGTFIGYTISGTVTDSATGGPLQGVVMTVYNNVGNPPVSVTTNASGAYTVPSLRDGIYIVMSAKAGYNISPTTGSVFQTISGSNAVKNYTAVAQ